MNKSSCEQGLKIENLSHQSILGVFTFSAPPVIFPIPDIRLQRGAQLSSEDMQQTNSPGFWYSAINISVVLWYGKLF